jgi:RNA polymerase sigma factor (sigma-70 family)
MLKPDNAEISDEILITESVAGNKKALEALIKRHQDYIYNISLRMFLDPDDALDATQEVLIKIVTNLQSFQHKSRFRTWVYRIALNHFLDAPQRKMEKIFAHHPEAHASAMVEHEETDLSEAAIEEVRMMCSMAMLLCLNREQRLLYIIGEIFGADHSLGADLFEISPANYRVKLHRAKADLLSYISGKCGLIDPNNPCRCHKKAKHLAQQGILDKNSMRFNAHFQQKVKEIVLKKKETISHQIKFRMVDLFQDSPFQIRDELDALLSDIVK